MNLHNLHIDIAAGLEYSLIEYYCNYNSQNQHPSLLNIAGNRNYTSRSTNIPELQNIEENEEELQYLPELTTFPPYTILCQFSQNLMSTYWNNAYINIPNRFSEYFTNHGDVTTLSIVRNNILIRQFTLSINRNATINGSPRFYITGEDGHWFQNWKHSNYTENGTITFNIISQNNILILE